MSIIKQPLRAFSANVELTKLVKKPVADLLGVSRAKAKILRLFGIKTIFDLGSSDIFAFPTGTKANELSKVLGFENSNNLVSWHPFMAARQICDSLPAKVATFAVRPKSANFWDKYLNYDKYPTSDSVWDYIGGSLGSYFGPLPEDEKNSCATRVSYGLNYGGAKIQKGADYINYELPKYKGKAGDGLKYVVSAAHMLDYLTTNFGEKDAEIDSAQRLDEFIASLIQDESAIFATAGSGGRGHSGVIRKDYNDPYLRGMLPVMVWKLPV